MTIGAKESAASADAFNVGVCQLMEHESLTVEDLMRLFIKASGSEFTDDRAVLG